MQPDPNTETPRLNSSSPGSTPSEATPQHHGERTQSLRPSAPAFAPLPGSAPVAMRPAATGPRGPARRDAPPQRFSPGSRGGSINANSLLNFQSGYGGRRGGQGSERGRPAGGAPRPRHAGRAARAEPFDRLKFLQANFRFLVSDAIDVARFGADADLMLDWEDVVRVEMLSAGPLQCPITLDTPLAPQCTPCGHVFDFRAVMGHHVERGGAELRRASPCPVCFTPVAARELRLAVVRPVAALKPGAPVAFQLLRRRRDSIIPKPIQAAAQPGASKGGSAGDVDIACSPYAKFTMVADPTPLWAADGEKLAAYAAQLSAEGGLDAAYEAPNVMAAMDALSGRAKAWAERRQRLLLERADPAAAPLLLSPEEAGQAAVAAVKAATTATLAGAAAQQKQRAAAASLEAEFPALAVAPRPPPTTKPAWGRPASALPAVTSAALPAATTLPAAERAVESSPRRPPTPPFSDDEDEAAASPPALGSSPAGSEAPPAGEEYGGFALSASPGNDVAGSAADDGHFYFYQAADGQWLFLHPFNMRMLLQRYGSYAACPPMLTAAVVEEEEVVQTEATRRRLRALAHLPLTGRFSLCEVDLAPLLPDQAMAPFAEELGQRQRKRTQRAKQEARRAKKEDQDAATAAAAAAAASAGPSAAELRAMPQLRGAGAGEDLWESVAGEMDVEEEQSGGVEPVTSEAQPGRAPSFARIAKLGFAATGPVVGAGSDVTPAEAAGGGQPSSQPTSLTTLPGVWGRVASSSAVAAQPSSPAGSSPPDAAAAAKGARGKKGGKQTLLFSTAQRRY